MVDFLVTIILVLICLLAYKQKVRALKKPLFPFSPGEKSYSYPRHSVFMDRRGKLIIIFVDEDGLLSVLEDTISPRKMRFVCSFPADSRCDYNSAMVSLILHFYNYTSREYWKAKKIWRNGL